MSNGNIYKCDFCNQDYSSYKSRWLHIKKYHTVKVSQKVSESKDEGKGESKGESKDKVYECRYCDKFYN